ncbi:hypothetical protein, partial [Bradyrhizobium sp. Leo121]|uniref:hypothetical protein n=1 Tax=Bradyrhizobium sp. Leo121 TaxID=1571195 RepID=UPI001A9366BE
HDWKQAEPPRLSSRWFGSWSLFPSAAWLDLPVPTIGSEGLVTVSNSLTKARFCFDRSQRQKRRGITHPPLFPAANRIARCDTRLTHFKAQGARHSHENP